MFGGIGGWNSRVPLKSNIFGSGGRGYSPIGSTKFGATGTNRESPLLGSSSPSSLISGYYERVDELKGYQLLDVVKLATNFFC